MKGEKSKTKKRTSSPITPVVDGATGGYEGNESSTDARHQKVRGRSH